MNNNTLVPELRFPEFVNEEEWDETILGKICHITNGKANVQDHVENGKYPLFDRSEVIKASNNFIFNCEAVIIPGEGMRFIPKYYEGKFNLHQRAYALKDFSCSGRFLFYSMLYRSALLSQKAVQSTVLSLRLPILQNFPIAIPNNPHEQQKIAACLSSLDELIAAHEDKLQALKDHKKGLMQNLFPQEGEKVPRYRFKEFENDGEWVEKKLGAWVDFVMGNAFKSDDFVEDGLQLIRMGNLYQGELQMNRAPVFLPKSFEKKYHHFLVKPKDLLMSMTGTMGKKDYGFVIEIPANSPVSLLNQRVLKIIPRKTCTRGFVLQLLKSAVFLEKIYSIPGGTKQANLSTKDLKAIDVSIPSLNEQQKIASCLSAVDDLITTQADKIEQLRLHKKGLMQGLFPKVND